MLALDIDLGVVHLFVGQVPGEGYRNRPFAEVDLTAWCAPAPVLPESDVITVQSDIVAD